VSFEVGRNDQPATQKPQSMTIIAVDQKAVLQFKIDCTDCICAHRKPNSGHIRRPLMRYRLNEIELGVLIGLPI